MYKSENSGSSWEKASDGLGTFNIAGVSASPHSEKITLAVSTDGGFYITDDGGIKWQTALDRRIKVTSSAFDPYDSSLGLIGTDKGDVYAVDLKKKKITAKNSLIKGRPISDIAVTKTADGKTIITASADGGLYRSTDNGGSFADLSGAIPDDRITDIAVYGNSDGRSAVFVTTWHEGVFCSFDGGLTWSRRSRGLTRDSQADDPRFESPHFSEIGLSPDFMRRKEIFAGGFDGLFKSDDGGISWKELETLSPDIIMALAVSPDYGLDSTIAAVPYIGYPHISRNKGMSWDFIGSARVRKKIKEFFGKKEPPSRYFGVAFSPDYRSDKTIFCTLLYRNILKFIGNHKLVKTVLPGASKDIERGVSIIVSPGYAQDKSIFLFTQYGACYRSSDGGLKIDLISELGNKGYNMALPCAISPDFLNDRTIYAFGSEGLCRSSDGGVTWNALDSSGALSTISAVMQIVISPGYAKDRTLFIVTDSGLFVTHDAGGHWKKVDVVSGSGPSFIVSAALSPDFARDGNILVSVKGRGIFKSTDGGDTFYATGQTLIKNNHELSNFGAPSSGAPILFSPAYASDRTIFGLGSASPEVFRSTDGGEKWEVLPVDMKD